MKLNIFALGFSILAFALSVFSVYSVNKGSEPAVSVAPPQESTVDSTEKGPSVGQASSSLDDTADEAKTGPTVEDVTKALARVQGRLANLEDMLDGAGPPPFEPPGAGSVDQWGRPPRPAPAGPLEKLATDFERQKRVAERRESLDRVVEQNTSRDFDTYGEAGYQKLVSLYDSARPSASSNRSTEETEKRSEALDQMVEEYPDAYTTSVAIAENALDLALQEDVASVESYYQMLTQNAGYSDVVTSQGVEAVPVIQTYLARQYIESGKTAEAAAILDNLEASYGDSVIMDRTELGTVAEKPAAEVIQELRMRLTQ